MVDDKGEIVAHDWVIGFMLGISFRSDEWGECILLTKNRALLIPILVYADPTGVDFLPDMPASEKQRRQASAYLAYQQIAGAVAAVRTICNPYRAAEANRTAAKTRRTRRARR
jgi:hypothetical protein